MPLKVIVVGAGLGGLAASISLKLGLPTHDVLVVESATELAEVGAGLQLTPNATRLLVNWGLKDSLESLASSPEEFLVRRHDGHKLLGSRSNFACEMLDKYGSFYWDIHRADLQIAMFERAKGLGVRFQFGTTVMEVISKTAEIVTDKKEIIGGDLVVAADGLWSNTRSSVLGGPSVPIPTGDLAYRIVLRSEDLTDPGLQEFVKIPRVCLWVGPECHAIFYPVKNNTMVNIVLLVPDNLPDNVDRMPGNLEEMKEIFSKWDPLYVYASTHSPAIAWGHIVNMDELETWYNDEATVAFLGDSCHPMLPYMAQGAGSALEDGAALGNILSAIHDKKDLPQGLRVYQDRHINHLPDGPEQVERDAIAEAQVYDQSPGYPFYWLDPAAQEFVYGYDVIEELEKRHVNAASGPNL
ncbi:hypothetical protein AJ79_03596 [Helicocarpus griseus UAMH5409]|uniref:FAD-binding domain-containing protein n=1 Tax=Helicocarpus griseus UAMH5409 TaxID=1447875 RepID=A0A2B7XXU0_9EURO|nr:hypothetical protein AJ79_03596 [Helicocarpus griseus UAMH5409]